MENEKSILNQIEPKKIEVPNDEFFASIAKSAIQSSGIVKSNSKFKIIYLAVTGVAAALILGFIFFNSANQEIVSKGTDNLAGLHIDEIKEYLNDEKEQQNAAKDAEYVVVSATTLQNTEDMFVSISTGDLVQYIEEEEVDLLGDEEVDDLFY